MPKKPTKPDGWLAEWVMSTRLSTPPRPQPSKERKPTGLTPGEAVKHPRYVPLAIWAQLMFGEYSPHANTLRRWVHDGRIQPQPKKMGRHWFVKVDAEYTPD